MNDKPQPASTPKRGAFDALLSERRRRRGPPAAFVAAAVVMVAVGWASVAEVDRIATATGVVAPEGRVRVAQHPEGGVVEEIFVSEGGEISAGAPLVRLDLGPEGLVREEIEVRLDAFRLERARLIAEAQQIDLSLPEEPSERRPELASAERETYASRRRDYESRQAVLRDQREQRALEVQSIAARLEAAQAKLDPLQEQIALIEGLVNRRLRTRSELLTLQRELAQVESEIAEFETALPLAQQALSEARQRTLSERARFRNAAAERLREVETEIARAQEQFERATTRARDAIVSSPIDGVVKSLSINSIGAVVGAREPIAEIVPSDERLVVEARLSPTDIGHVSVGQEAVVKLTTYDFLRYGVLEGRVAQIAAAADVDESGAPYFRLVIETTSDALEVDGARFPISAGMEALVDLRLGRRSVMSYLLAPVMRLQNEAFRDR